MPKYAFKPSCCLSKKSKKLREKHKSICFIPQISITTNTTQESPRTDICDIISPNVNDTTVNNHAFSNNSNEKSSGISYGNLPEFEQNESSREFNINTIQSTNTPIIFQSQLASFIVSSGLSRNKTTDLLKLLKSVDNIECLKDLPSDSRTLLSTPVSGQVKISHIADGEYIHFGLVNGLIHIYKVNNELRQLSVFELWFNIDGLPIDKRGSSFWPILCGILTKRTVIPFIIGAYFGSKKPHDVHEYLSEFITELKDLIENGVIIENSTITIMVKGIIADAPARAFIKQIKGHTGYYGCEKCVEEGDYLSFSYRNKTSGNICFPNDTAELRTDESFVQRLNEEHHISISPLLSIPGLGLVSCIPLDYMHLCCLGIMKKILRFFIRGTRGGSCGSTRLSNDQIISVNSRMKTISKWLSTDFARYPTDLNNYNTFKATELRQILMYTGPYIFKNIVTIPVYNNFMTLHIAMRILGCSKTVFTQNYFAKALTKHFLKTFCIIYGRINASYNVHSIIHLPEDAKKYGVLDSFSSFPYENFLQHLKKIVRPGRSPLVQLYNRIN